MNTAILYYTDNTLEPRLEEWCQKQLLKSSLPIVSVSLKSIDFGHNILVPLERSYPTLIKQIIIGLDFTIAENIFFCEHDVLYHPSHFAFTPPHDYFYYNANVWRWDYPRDRAVTYDRLLQLSGMCCKRELALEHFRKRLELIEKNGWQVNSPEPQWQRRMGYEPGTKSIKRGGYFEENYGVWWSEFPNIDIRHKGTFSPPKLHLNNFKHPPTGWKETKISEIPGWNLNV